MEFRDFLHVSGNASKHRPVVAVMTNLTAWQTAFGGPDLIEIQDKPLPEPAAGEVRVRVAAAGLNPIDYKIAAMPMLAEMFGGGAPGGYGNDFAGIVDALGADVTAFRVGDRVVGQVRGSAVQQFTTVSTDALTLVPDAVSLEVASTTPVPGRTADVAISTLNLTPEDVVLIGGAAGGVGVFAVQYAVATGATVIATASPDNHEFLRELGATPVTYGAGLADRVREIAVPTAAADLQGTETASTAIELGVDPARITTIAAGPAAPAGVLSVGGGGAQPDSTAKLLAAIADGKVRVEISGAFPLADTKRGVERLAAGHVRGKLVVIIDPDIA